MENGLCADDVYIPKTIRDAIDVVKAVGQSYLYVDQLCNIQDGNPRDKRANVERMDHVYNHALFTIVAADSPHADSGLKGIRCDPDRCHQIIEDGIIKNARMFLPIRMNMDFSLWEDRAWCFQEKLLSRRLLVFAGGFAVWHCRGGTWREDVNALDGDKDSVSFPWLRLTSILPEESSNSTELTRAGLQEGKEDESVRLMRLPAMCQYIEAVEDLSKRTISNSCDMLNAFQGLLNVLGGSKFLDSSFRKGLPGYFLDVALLWQLHGHARRRQNNINADGQVISRAPPSWTWAGWESTKKCDSGSKGAPVKYDKPFEVRTGDAGMFQRLGKLGEERIRPRKGTFYCINDNGTSLQELGLFSMPGMGAKSFKDWDARHAKPAPKPRLNISLNTLHEGHLIVQTEVATLELGKECWRTRTVSKVAGVEHCAVTFQDADYENKERIVTGVGDSAAVVRDIVITTSHEHWIHVPADGDGVNVKVAGVVKLDADYHTGSARFITAIVLSEAQYLGNETTPDVLGYPLYNLMLIGQIRGDSGELFAERIGLGKIYKYAWRAAKPARHVIILE